MLSDPTQFKKYISGAKQRALVYQRPNIPNMKLMLTSMCLRRNRSIIDLPGVHESIFELAFTRQERMLYDSHVILLKKSITQATDRGSQNKEFSHRPILEAILRLRIFCNVGVVGKLEVDQLFGLMQQGGDTNCSWCDNEVGAMNEGESINRPQITHCCSIICGECVPAMETSRNGLECPLCLEKHKGDLFLSFGGDKEREKTDLNSNYSWPSKLLAVAQNLIEHIDTEKRYVLLPFRSPTFLSWFQLN